MPRAPFANLMGDRHIGQRTSGLKIRQEHQLGRVEHDGGLCHEVDPAEDDEVGIRALGFSGEVERVPDEVGHILDGAFLVVVGEDHGLPLTRKLPDLLLQEGQAPRIAGRMPVAVSPVGGSNSSVWVVHRPLIRREQ